MTDRKPDDVALDVLFEAARGSNAPSDAFVANLMADAEEAAAGYLPRPAKTAPPKRAPFWQSWLPATGLTAATLAGVWIGVSLPESDFGAVYLTDIGFTESTLGDFVPSFGMGALVEDAQ